MNPYSRGKQILIRSLQLTSGQTQHVQRTLQQAQQTFERNQRTFEKNQRTFLQQTQSYPMTSTPLHPGQDERQPLETPLSQLPLSDLLGSVLNESTDFINNISLSAFGDAFDSFQQTDEPLNSLDRRETIMSLGQDYIHDENNENASTCMEVIGAKPGDTHVGKNSLMPDGTITETNGLNEETLEVSDNANQGAQQDIRGISGTEGESTQINGMMSMTIPDPEPATDDRPISESGDACPAIVGDVIGIPLNQECRQDEEKTLVRDVIEQPRRKRKGDPSTWTKHIHKRRRETGQVYEGRKYSDSVNQFQTVLKDERKIGERCHCKVKKNVCHTITNEERQQIFNEFWSLTWHEKEVYVRAMVETTDVQRKTVENSRRSVSFAYFLKVNGQKKQICKTMFLSTTGLKNTWLHQHILPGSQIRENPEEPDDRRHGKQSSDKQFVITFLQSLPKMPSHYCRQSTSKAYLEPIFRTFSDLYKTYQDRCMEDGVKIMGRTVFMEVFHNMNIGLFQPRKDQCDTCCAYEAGNLQEEEWTLHRQRKESAQKEKENDKKTALDGKEKIKVITMDLQRVLLSPSLQASALYYKTKLTVHNFTVYDLATKKNGLFCLE